jgi:hypothetical protein
MQYFPVGLTQALRLCPATSLDSRAFCDMWTLLHRTVLRFDEINRSQLCSRLIAVVIRHFDPLAPLDMWAVSRFFSVIPVQLLAPHRDTLTAVFGLDNRNASLLAAFARDFFTTDRTPTAQAMTCAVEVKSDDNTDNLMHTMTVQNMAHRLARLCLLTSDGSTAQNDMLTLWFEHIHGRAHRYVHQVLVSAFCAASRPPIHAICAGGNMNEFDVNLTECMALLRIRNER